MKIAWIGLGNMGGPMAANLVKAGYEVSGFDLSTAAQDAAKSNGVTIASSVADAVTDSQLVFTMLPAGRHVLTVMNGPDGVLANVAAGTLVIDSSTIDIETARALHDSVSAAGDRFLDAPVSGGVVGAEAGSLTFMIGGAESDLDEARPLIQAMAGRIFHAGGPGNGQAAKLANNLMLGTNLAAMCEGTVLAGRLGVDPQVFFDIATASSGDSWALRSWYPVEGVVPTAAVNRDFAGGFAIELMRKDVGLALQAGSTTNTDLPFGAMVVEYLDRMIGLNWGGRDSSAVVKLFDGSLDPVASDSNASS